MSTVALQDPSRGLDPEFHGSAEAGLLHLPALGLHDSATTWSGPIHRGAGHAFGGAVLAGLVFAIVVAYAAVWPPPLDRLAPSPLLGEAAPLFTEPEVSGGSPESLYPPTGQWAVVNFFATWCGPCRKELPELVRFSARHGGDIRVVTVVYDDDPVRVRAVVDSRQGRWPVVADPNGVVARKYSLRAVPDTFLIDPQGIVVAAIIGGVTSDGLESTLARLKAPQES